MINRINRI